MGIGGSHALFKSTVLGLLAQVRWRLAAWLAGVACRPAARRAAPALPSPAPACAHLLAARFRPQFDWRFGALVRLVKLWARQHGANDSANGTLNSFALTLLVRCGVGGVVVAAWPSR